MAILTTDAREIKEPPMPDKVTVYDEQGNALEVFPVDARECVATGRYFLTPPETNAKPEEVATEGVTEEATDEVASKETEPSGGDTEPVSESASSEKSPRRGKRRKS